MTTLLTFDVVNGGDITTDDGLQVRDELTLQLL